MISSFTLPRDKVEDFNIIKYIYKIEGKLQNLTPLRVGVGAEAGEFGGVDLAVIRLKGKPYIPASSLKGVFRSHLERVSTLKYGEENVHSPFDKDIEEREKERVCAVCGIFGNITIASHVVIFNSLIEGTPSYHYKPGIAISRKFASVAQGPFIEEYVEPGHLWTFHMEVININLEGDGEDDPRPSLVKTLLQDLEKGTIQVGGRKSIGAGLVRLISDKIRVLKTYPEDGEMIYDKEVKKPW